MKTEEAKAVALVDAFTNERLLALLDRIEASGALGRSKIYAQLLRYLVEASLARRRVKELEIALDVLGKSTDFDIAQNSAVRVTVHQLRKKLDNYFTENELDSTHRLVIPSGRYSVEALKIAKRSKGLGRFINLTDWKGIALVCSSLATLAILAIVVKDSPQDSASAAAPVQNTRAKLWQDVLADDTPVLFAMGDYQYSDSWDVQKLVRDFNSHSPTTSDNLSLSDVLSTENYLDLDLSYIPPASAFALATVVPMLQQANKTVNLTMMADLTDEDVASNHVVYIGTIAEMEQFRNLLFASSGLQMGRTLDELVNLRTNEVYLGQNIHSRNQSLFHDYAFVSTIPLDDSKRLIAISGMGAAGVMQSARAVVDELELGYLTQALANRGDSVESSFEALYEVYGMDKLNFSSRLIYSDSLNTSAVSRQGITVLSKEGIGGRPTED